VWAGLHFYESWASGYLRQCCHDFPDSWYFPKLRGWRLAEDRKWEEAAREYARALELSPDNLGALYSLAAVQKNIEESSSNMQLKTIDLYQQFLSRCEPDHPKAPEGILHNAHMHKHACARAHAHNARTHRVPTYPRHNSALRHWVSLHGPQGLGRYPQALQAGSRC
jgi:tetratricopeptide (TPR) repeat protein